MNHGVCHQLTHQKAGRFDDLRFDLTSPKRIGDEAPGPSDADAHEGEDSLGLSRE